MSRTIQDILKEHGLTYSQILGEEKTVVSIGLEGFNQALKGIETIIKDSKPEIRFTPRQTGQDIRQIMALGYKQGIDDYEANLLKVMK